MMQYMDITPWAGEFHGKCHYVDGVFRLAWAYIIAPLACHLGIKKLSAEQPMKEASARERWVIIFLQAGLEWLREIYSEDELLNFKKVLDSVEKNIPVYDFLGFLYYLCAPVWKVLTIFQILYIQYPVTPARNICTHPRGRTKCLNRGPIPSAVSGSRHTH